MSTIGNPDFEAVIGLEVHAQLQTHTKAFTAVTAEYGEAPNTQVSPLCLGLPGTLPALNENLVRFTVRMGLATGCEIAPRSIFARKNYFYPDLPKGFQISQFETPLCSHGMITIRLEGYEKTIGITRIHMEEDAGKSIHDQDPMHSLIDLNRAGTPLIEIVSEPELRTPAEAYAYLVRIRQIVRYLGICDGNMEEGSLRCDANVSVRPRGQQAFGTRTELKNMNSFRNVERAIQYEIDRQIALIQQGGSVVQQTLLWDPVGMKTRAMRSKEQAHDYRYFPEPDLPAVVITESYLTSVRAEIPEMPDVRKERFQSQYGLSQDDATTLTDSRELADYFEGLSETAADPRGAANLVLTQILRTLNERGWAISDFPLDAPVLAGLLRLRQQDKINSSAMTAIFETMLEQSPNVSAGVPASHGSEWAEHLAQELNLLQVSDDGFLAPIIDNVLKAHPDEVDRYREGKTALLGFFMGKVMQASGGKANPEQAKSLLLTSLGGS